MCFMFHDVITSGTKPYNLNKIPSLFFLIFILSSCQIATAQTKERPWAFGFGWNIVDFYPNGEGVYPLENDAKPFSEELFSEFFNSTDHYNQSLLAIRFSFGRYLFRDIFAEASVAYNNISEYGDQEVDNLDYIGLDASLNYSFRNLIQPRGDGWADPFIGVGAGWTWVEEERTRDMLGTGNIDGTVGFGWWITNKISLIYKVTFKYIAYDHEHKDFTDSHFQHFFGMKYVFNNSRTRCY